MKLRLHSRDVKWQFHVYAAPVARQEHWGVRLTDPAVLRALAHPARLRMLSVLQSRDGATATQCAQVVGLSPSACSWHLRQLAAAGLVQAGGGGTDGREKRWTASLPSWQVSLEDIEADPVEAGSLDLAVTHALLQSADETVEAYTISAASGLEPPSWREASLVSNMMLRLSADELTELTERLRELLRPYTLRSRPEAGPDDRTVLAALRLVPATPNSA